MGNFFLRNHDQNLPDEPELSSNEKRYKPTASQISQKLKTKKGVKLMKKIKKLLGLHKDHKIVIHLDSDDDDKFDKRPKKISKIYESPKDSKTKESVEDASTSQNEQEVIWVPTDSLEPPIDTRSRNPNLEYVKAIKYYSVSKKSFEALDSEEWISDEVINWWVRLIQQTPLQYYPTETHEFIQHTMILNSYVFPKMHLYYRDWKWNSIDSILDSRKVKLKITKPIRHIVFPVFWDDSHWLVFRISLDKKQLQVYDSYNDGLHDIKDEIKVVKEYWENSLWIRQQIRNFHLENDPSFSLGEELSTTALTFEVNQVECTQQKNSFDWGIYAWAFMYFLVQREKIPCRITSNSRVKRKLLKKAITEADVIYFDKFTS
jgi:hypothetical protein